jgi:hypothetical protein
VSCEKGTEVIKEGLNNLARHSSVGWNPAFQQIAEELDPSLRWDDGLSDVLKLS